MTNVKDYVDITARTALTPRSGEVMMTIDNLATKGETYIPDNCKSRAIAFFRQIAFYSGKTISAMFSSCGPRDVVSMDISNATDISQIKISKVYIYGLPITATNAEIILEGGTSSCEGALHYDDFGAVDFGCGSFSFYDVRAKYTKLIGSRFLRFKKIDPKLTMTITVQAYGNSPHTVINVVGDDSYSCNIGERSFTANKTITPKNLLLKMPKGFENWTPHVHSGHDWPTAYVDFWYYDESNQYQNIGLFFKTKNGQPAKNGDWWNNEMKKLLFNQFYSRISPIYLESISNLNYFIKLHEKGRALYDERGNNLGVTGIIEYQNPFNKPLVETNLVQPFYEYKQFSPQTYNFNKKIFLRLDNCPAAIVNTRDKKVIFSLNANDRIEIYFNDIDTLTDATEMYLISKRGKERITFENCNVSVNIPMKSDAVKGQMYICGAANNSCSSDTFGLITSIQTVSYKDPFGSGYMYNHSYYFKVTTQGEKIHNWNKNGWFDNKTGFNKQANADQNYYYLEGGVKNNLPSKSQAQALKDYGYDGYQYVRFLEFVAPISIEFDAKDINKDLVLTLPTYTASNASATKIVIDGDGGFIISGFNLDKVEFKVEFDSRALDINTTRVHEINQRDFMNDHYMNRLIAEEGRLSRKPGGYKYVNVVHYNPNEDHDGSVWRKLSNFIRSSSERALLGTVALIAGLVSMAITLTQKILEAAGVKISKNIKLFLDVIQIGLNLTLAFGTLIDRPKKFLTKLAKYDQTIKDMTNFARIAVNAIQTPTVLLQIPGYQIDVETGLNNYTLINWKEGIKKVALSSATGLSESEKNDIAEAIVTSAYNFATIGLEEIDLFIRDTNNDESERTIMAYLQNVLKYGAEYIYQTAGGMISIAEARTINLVFVKKASLSLLEGLVNIYHG